MGKNAPGAYRRQRSQVANKDLIKGIVTVIPKGQTVIDIGAQNGEYVYALRNLGYNIVGIDGTPNIEELTGGEIEEHNLAEEIIPQYERNWEWGLFFEVGEHIPKEYEEQVLDNVAMLACRGLIITWAGIGQRGIKHFNCHTQVYIASEFAKRGWFVDEEDTVRLRSFLTGRRSPCERVMVLKNE